jgi:hypothetical protein
VQLLGVRDALFDVFDHGEMMRDGDVAELLPQQLKNQVFDVGAGFVEVIDEPSCQKLLVVQEEAVLG